MNLLLSDEQLNRPIPRNGGADQLHRVPIIRQPPRDETKGLEW